MDQNISLRLKIPQSYINYKWKQEICECVWKPTRFWWTESPPKSAQQRIFERRPAQKRTLESKSTLLSAQKSAHIFCRAPTRLKKLPIRVNHLISQKSAQESGPLLLRRGRLWVSNIKLLSFHAWVTSVKSHKVSDWVTGDKYIDKDVGAVRGCS